MDTPVLIALIAVVVVLLVALVLLIQRRRRRGSLKVTGSGTGATPTDGGGTVR